MSWFHSALVSFGFDAHIVGMEANPDTMNLSGKLLIAMPGMQDPRFEKSVVYICSHSDEGAMGLIVNKPTPQIEFADLLERLDIPTNQSGLDTGIYFGGPVETSRGFVLHSTDYQIGGTTLVVDDQFAMTATRDVLKDLANGQGPDNAILALGYSGWGAGQLENELLQNGWLSCDADAGVVFDMTNTMKWVGALKILGVDALALSATAGRA